MDQYELDDVDRGILHALQENARDATIEAMGEKVDVSPSTVRNRIEAMESAGVIQGYSPHVDYARAGYDLHVLYRCRTDVDEREDVATDALDVDGVVHVHELLEGRRNLVVEAVATDPDHLTSIQDALSEGGLDIRESEYVRSAHAQPWDHFGVDVVDD